MDPKRTRVDLRFLATAVAWMTALYALYYHHYAPDGGVGRAITAYLAAQARGAGAVIGLFDSSVRVTGTTINGAFPLQIVKSCSSLDAQALYVAAVLAFPASLGKRAFGVVLGVSALTLLNLGRIALLSFVGMHASESFDAMHEEWLPLALVACAGAGFLAWARWAGDGAASVG